MEASAGGSAQTAVGGASFTYDASGNLVTDGSRTLVYNGDNRLTSVTNAAGVTAYAYGPDGSRERRVKAPMGR